MESASPLRPDRPLILVNGPPASGKTTPARSLSAGMGIPLLSKDVVKETLFDALGTGDRDWSRKLGAASMEVLWSIARDCPGTLVLESWFPDTSRKHVEAGLRKADFASVIEVWCDCPPPELIRRSIARLSNRHQGHLDLANLEQLRIWAETAHPLAIGPVVRVDANGRVAVTPLVQQIRRAMQDCTRVRPNRGDACGRDR